MVVLVDIGQLKHSLHSPGIQSGHRPGIWQHLRWKGMEHSFVEGILKRTGKNGCPKGIGGIDGSGQNQRVEGTAAAVQHLGPSAFPILHKTVVDEQPEKGGHSLLVIRLRPMATPLVLHRVAHLHIAHLKQQLWTSNIARAPTWSALAWPWIRYSHWGVCIWLLIWMVGGGLDKWKRDLVLATARQMPT